MRRFYRSTSNVQLAGVCSGFAEYFDLDPTLVRFVVIVATICTGFVPGILIYIAAALVFPKKGH